MSNKTQNRNKTEAPKVIVIGLDGATLDIVHPMVQRGRLPNLARLMQQGSWGPLRSTLQPSTPNAWSAFATGCNAGRHGIYDFIQRVEGSYEMRFVNGSFRRAPSIWNLLSQRGRRVGVVNVPFTYPPDKVQGYLISGFDAPGLESGFTHPDDLYEEIVREVGRYDLRGTFPVGKRQSDYREEDVARVISNRTKVGRYLLEHHPVDLFVLVYGSTDHVQHVFWRYMQRHEGCDPALVQRFGSLIPHTYELVDEGLGRMLDGLDLSQTTVVVMSDHGGGELRGVIHLNNWLASHGWLAYRSTASWPALRAKLVEQAAFILRRYMKRQFRDWLKTKAGGIKDKAGSLSYFSRLDWSGTQAFSWGMYGNISLNLKGREPQGIVEPEDYDKLCDMISQALLSLKEPDSGRPLVRKVHRGRKLYSGPFIDQAPDLVIEWEDYSYYTQGNLQAPPGQIFLEKLYIESSDFLHTGTHRMDGLVMLQGPGIKSGNPLDGAQIADIFPTLLYAMGEAIPRGLDGRLLTQAYKPEWLENNQPQAEKPGKEVDTNQPLDYREEDLEEVTARLRSLGYI